MQIAIVFETPKAQLNLLAKEREEAKKSYEALSPEQKKREAREILEKALIAVSSPSMRMLS